MLTARTQKRALPGGLNLHIHSLELSILKVLAYFDMFSYPLTAAEIRQFLDQPVIITALENMLTEMTRDSVIYRHEEFYSLQNDYSLAEKRKEGNTRAEKMIREGLRIGKFLQGFPFVRGIAISGSLSKNFADEKADIDFFIITKGNRLWIARTLMHVFKKLTYLLGRQHFYCMNYYIDEHALSIEQRNIYTAIEIKTLLPVSGRAAIEEFFDQNAWADDFLPVYYSKINTDLPGKQSWLKNLAEKCMDNRAGRFIDDLFMQMTERRWKKKEIKGIRNKKGLPMGLITGKHFARTDPGNFQEKLLDRYYEKVNSLLD